LRSRKGCQWLRICWVTLCCDGSNDEEKKYIEKLNEEKLLKEKISNWVSCVEREGVEIRRDYALPAADAIWQHIFSKQYM
jgi:hypothetical protein